MYLYKIQSVKTATFGFRGRYMQDNFLSGSSVFLKVKPPKLIQLDRARLAIALCFQCLCQAKPTSCWLLLYICCKDLKVRY